MEVPKLRQPKAMMQADTNEKLPVSTGTGRKKKAVPTDFSQVIISVKNDNMKLVVSSDAYNAILMSSDLWKCLICEIQVNIYDTHSKNCHKQSKKHASAIQKYPHLDEYGENLIRKIKDIMYCTICNVIVTKIFINRHIMSDMHKQELQRAINKGAFYKPSA